MHQISSGHPPPVTPAVGIDGQTVHGSVGSGSACPPIDDGGDLAGAAGRDSPAGRPTPRNFLVDAAILLALCVIGYTGYRVAPLLHPKTDLTLPISACNVGEGPCTARLPDGREIELSIQPRPIPVLKPLRIEATVRGAGVRGVDVDFAGTEMQMGYNRPRLERQSDDASRFAGQTSLPVCITGTMEWEATLLVDTGRTLIAIPFRFVSSH
ncbi:hypothetical protein [Accumulibacter sp.]|uniref:hypothetical protein n=1 Tax=Accumulibacter sp. TaxID=2053492 RepID=UPI0025E9F1A6|nr:hypothetical protein [Accumulibacter sp.]MCM8594886.1 hypothetical protein [Accumulibacter sp.]MCM8627828.1 hypothetical protein [Accumulibacter sp.]MDS4049032.1 hypothetical protein [Accumulibacter sp.]